MATVRSTFTVKFKVLLKHEFILLGYDEIVHREQIQIVARFF